MLSSASRRRAMTNSRNFRSGFFDGDRYRFFASCCVIVLAPRENDPRAQSAWSDSRSCVKSTPSCWKNASSSAMRTARRSSGETCPSATQCWTFLGCSPFARASLRAERHERGGGRVRSGESADVRQRQVTYADPTRTARRRRRRGRGRHLAGDARRGRAGNPGRLAGGRSRRGPHAWPARSAARRAAGR